MNRDDFTASELDEVAAAMAAIDGVGPDCPEYEIIWSTYQRLARRTVAAITKVREIRHRRGKGRLNRSLLGA